ncbi:MAG TPA: hypothetical protein VFK06_24160 [Candidatus Angelobacter sp.]|nr:hypothetical protein [Candidatus Angelobacter sp.]
MKDIVRLMLGVLVVGVLAAGVHLVSQNKAVVVNTGAESIPKYDVAQEKTIQGVVKAVTDHPCPILGAVGTHLTVKTDTEEIEVHLAPAAFLKNYGMAIHNGAQVSVTGVPTHFGGKQGLLARVVMAGRETFVFRAEKGAPYW